MPVAVNVGDATNVLAIALLLGNVETLGVRKALLVLREVERMARESVEGQAIELGWIADERFDLEDRDYVRMAYKKTCWYTVIAPLRVGVICGARPGPATPLDERADPADRARVPGGDRLPDPRRPAQPRGRRDPLREGDERRPVGGQADGHAPALPAHGRAAGASPRPAGAEDVARAQAPEDVEWLLGAMTRAGSLEHGRRLAVEYSERALELDEGALPMLAGGGDDRRFVREMLRYVIERTK